MKKLSNPMLIVHRMPILKEELLKLTGDTLELRVQVPSYNIKKQYEKCVLQSKQYICGCINVEALIDIDIVRHDCGNIKVYLKTYLKFTKWIDIRQEDISFTFIVEEPNQLRTADVKRWCLISKTSYFKKPQFIVDKFITVYIGLQRKPSPLASIYNDTVLTDFKISGIKCSVNMHKAVLANCSPVFMNIFTEQRKESTSGIWKLDVTADTLQDFKKYLYLHELPYTSERLQELLKLAISYMINELVIKCSIELMHLLTEDNVVQMFEFAGEHQITFLFKCILRLASSGSFDVEKIPEPVSSEESDFCPETASEDTDGERKPCSDSDSDSWIFE